MAGAAELADITFFYSNPVERETVVPVAREAERRGYTARLTDSPFEKARIGLYCQHDCFPRNSALSFVMLHDMGQGQLNWPNLWRAESWNDFDVGILPGETWSRRWQDSSSHPYSRPRLGVFALGWPKSDGIFSEDSESLSREAESLRESLNLPHQHSILYAPAWENDCKQNEFVQALIDLPVNLLLKQFPWTDQWPDMVSNVAEMNALHRGIAPNVCVIEPTVSIMTVLEICDVMVSEESSCLLEALLKCRPAVSVSDWMIPDTFPPRLPAAPFDFLIRTPKSGLRKTISTILEDLDASRKSAAAHRDLNFANLGHSAGRIMDLIEAVQRGEPPDTAAVRPAHGLEALPLKDWFRKYLRKAIYTLKYWLGIKQPLKKILLNTLRSK